jgi:hypothetical protein
MEDLRSKSRRTDDQLEAILDESGHWTVNGRQGKVLCSAASLHRAIDRAHEYGVAGAVVTAVCRLPSDNIIVFEEQMERLRQTIVMREMVHPAARHA